jgi:hypothetical protein
MSPAHRPVIVSEGMWHRGERASGRPYRQPGVGPSAGERFVLLVIGIPVAFGGLGLVATFGILSFLGMPLLIIGLGCISGAIGPATTPQT